MPVEKIAGYERHFIRGCFDGDGTLSWRKNRNTFRIGFIDQEENITQAHAITDYKEQVLEWQGVRRGLSITAASIGDRLFWGTLKPFTLLFALCIWLFVGVNFFEIN